MLRPPMRHRAVLLLAAVPLLFTTASARAGSITAESIWDQQNALQRARSQLPAGATVTGSHCTVVNVRTGNYRYICTVDYSNTPAPTSSESSAPAP